MTRRSLETFALVVVLSALAVGMGWGVGLLGYCYEHNARAALCGASR